MTSLVYDFKDIHSRMKGDLLPRKQPKVEMIQEVQDRWRLPTLCTRCFGSRRDHNGVLCSYCNASGIEP